MAILFPILRFVHIAATIFWVGTSLFLLFFLEPTVRSLGQDGGKFMQRLLGGTRFSLAMTLAGWLTILTGLAMYFPVTGSSLQIMLGQRLPLTLGAIAGIAAGAVGGMVQGRASAAIAALGARMAGAGGPPAAADLAEMGRLQGVIRQGSVVSTTLMVIAVIGMTWRG
jgi:putative copper export protein